VFSVYRFDVMCIACLIPLKMLTTLKFDPAPVVIILPLLFRCS